MQAVLTFTIIALAVGYAVWRFVRRIRGKGDACSCHQGDDTCSDSCSKDSCPQCHTSCSACPLCDSCKMNK